MVIILIILLIILQLLLRDGNSRRLNDSSIFQVLGRYWYDIAVTATDGSKYFDGIISRDFIVEK
ncbi:hypothetical protein D6D54_03655 [Spiroplasma poulsonii]|uniref:Uncharacterized protein n=1 Tax=Spiroplasma poulsonii TaxID=2138 RepID=A0A3S0U961_9MOLU|nr:hypothetical protein [Spiroplasma poulsonii]RUP77636.1 hypothetical protein D6D54_03655 [Spiroplasma poulsonii]